MRNFYSFVYVLLFVSLVFFTTPVKSQTLLEQNRDHVVLKWAPLSLFEYYNTFLLGVEIPFRNPRFTFQQELGYGHASMSIWFTEDEARPNRHVVRSNSQFRFYIKEWKSFRLFTAAEYFLRRSRTYAIEFDPHDCEGGCADYSGAPYDTERIVNALHLKFGFQAWLSRRISLEVYTGYGYRTIKSRSLTPGVSPLWRNKERWWDIPQASLREPLPSFAPGFQIGLLLGK